MTLKDLDDLEEGLFYLDDKSKEIQQGIVNKARQDLMIKTLASRDVKEAKRYVAEYEELYKQSKEISAFLLVSKQPRPVVEAIIKELSKQRG